MSSAPQVEIRLMATGDVDRVMKIAASLPSSPQWPRKVWSDALDPDVTPRRIALVAEQFHAKPLPREELNPKPVPGAILGFVVASLLPPQAELEIIAVAGQSQRKGLGSQLMRALADQMIEAGIAEILLEVRASNRPAIGLYSRFGFSQSGVRKSYYTDPIEDAALMAKQLSAPLEP